MATPGRAMFGWLSRYEWRYLPGDVIAGLTVATLLIPQGIAYALLAGVPPVVGLYTSMLPVIVYGLLGSTRFLTLGPTAITSVMVLATLQDLAEPGSDLYTQYALTLALCLGGVYLLMGLLRLGFLINLLSQPVLSGYVNAAALIILVSQMQHVLGLDVPRSSQIFDLAWDTLERLPQADGLTALLSALSFGILYIFRHHVERYLVRWVPHLTIRIALTRLGPLVAVIIMSALVGLFELQVRTISAIPPGLPELAWRPLRTDHLDTILFGAVAIAIVGFMEGASTAKSLSTQRRERFIPDQELRAMGLANIAGFFIGGFPSTTSISRSAVNFTTGANTGLSSVIAGLCVAVAVAVFAPLLGYLPQLVLAVVIIFSVINLLDFSTLAHLWHYNRLETLPFVVTFVAVLGVGIAMGILSGILVALLLYLWRTTRVNIVELGRDGYTSRYLDRARYDTQAIPQVLIVRVDESLFFANAQYLDKQLRNYIADRPHLHYVILAADAINSIDASALQTLGYLQEDLSRAGIELYFAGMKDDVREQLARVHFVEKVGGHRFFPNTHSAVEATQKLVDDMLPI